MKIAQCKNCGAEFEQRIVGVHVKVFCCLTCKHAFNSRKRHKLTYVKKPRKKKSAPTSPDAVAVLSNWGII